MREYNKRIHNEDYCMSCYFRTVAKPPFKKVLLQLTERCNLNCEHCFVSATSVGRELAYKDIEETIVPLLKKLDVKKVTLTGGEPLVYKNILEVVNAFTENDIEISICTNATLVEESFIDNIDSNKVHFNVSLDGFSNESHGRFRGNEDKKLFKKILDTIQILGKKKLLNGILVTPNNYSSLDEYEQICKFGKDNGAKYVLINPLSELGRGQESIDIAYTDEKMLELKENTEYLNDENFEVVYIRFPNISKKPLEKCVAGQLFYIFSNGNITACPYMVFAANNEKSKYDPNEFIIGSIYDDISGLHKKIKNFKIEDNEKKECHKNCEFINCKGGCLAAKISKGSYITECDDDLCPHIQ